MAEPNINRSMEAVWRIEAPRLIGALSRVLRDVGLAEELAQDALVAALERWPRTGVPDRPAAWLMAAAKNRAIDRLRRRKLLDRSHAEIGRGLDAEQEAAVDRLDAALDDDVGDDVLRLIFTACHPVLTRDSQVALTLRMVGGLATDEIARAFLTTEPTIAQRIVRAKRTLSEAGVPFELPRGEDRGARLGAVLGVVYLIFNEGYAATAGGDWMRPQLAAEAIRLARILAALAPDQAEVHGLLALMEIQASRNAARVGADGEPILLLEQDRGRWDRLLIQRGLAALDRALASGSPPGPYTLQAAIAACHARASTPEATDWRAIADLYGALQSLDPSPVVALNRAVAIGMAEGPAAGLALADSIEAGGALKAYHLLQAVRGDLLLKLGRTAEARAAFANAAELTRNERERALLLRRAETG